MALPTSNPSLKRTFDQSGLEDGQDKLATSTSAEGRKLVHLMKDDANTDDMKASLDSLPTEVINLVASNLSTPELLSLRLASRKIEVLLFNDFAAYYFAKKQFMLTPESLQCLVDISLHPKLSSVLQHVIISLDQYQSSFHDRVFAVGDDANSVNVRAVKYRQGFYDQATLLATGQDCELLTQAFRRLPNLKTVGLRDYNNGRRWRDGEGAEWRAYGASTVMRETGMKLLGSGARVSFNNARPFHAGQFFGSGSGIVFAARAFTTVLQALGRSGAKPDNFEILFRERGNGLPDYAFHIPGYLEPMVAPLLGSLKSLLLTVDLSYPKFIPDSTPASEFDRPDYALQHFLSLLPNLTHLRLNVQNGWTRDVTRMLEWLASTDVASDTQILPRLEQLDFGMMEATTDLIGRVVGKFSSTLRVVRFWKATIEDEQMDASSAQQDIPGPTTLWAELLSQLPRLAPGLDRISVGCLKQKCTYETQNVTIKVRSGEGLKCVQTRDYRREEMRDLERFEDMLEEELLLPGYYPQGDDSEADDDSNSDDSNDDSGDGETE